MVDVFISYSRTNRDLVCRLAEAIGGLGYVVWWDEELPAHLSYGDVITQKIGEAKATLVVWSRESAASEWVRAEADLARNEKKLIQTAIDDCTPPLPFNQIQYAAIGDWTGEEDHPGWRKARASLAALCGPPPAGALQAASEAPAPVAVAPPPLAAMTPAPPVARTVSGSRTTRLAFVAIAASLLIILTVGGLVLFRGPPAAQAAAVIAPTPTPVPVQPPAPAATPPKTVVDEPAGQAEDDSAAQASETADYGSDSGDDY